MAALTKEELIAKRDQLESEIKEFGETLAESGERMDQDQKDNWNRLNTELDEITANLKERDAVEKRIRDLNEEGKTETGASFNVGTARTKNIYDLSSVERSFSDPSVEGQELKDRAKRALDSRTCPTPTRIRQEARHVERLVQKLDGEDGAFSRYLVATDNPAYKRAFPKLLTPVDRRCSPARSSSQSARCRLPSARAR